MLIRTSTSTHQSSKDSAPAGWQNNHQCFTVLDDSDSSEDDEEVVIQRSLLRPIQSPSAHATNRQHKPRTIADSDTDDDDDCVLVIRRPATAPHGQPQASSSRVQIHHLNQDNPSSNDTQAKHPVPQTNATDEEDTLLQDCLREWSDTSILPSIYYNLQDLQSGQCPYNAYC